MNVADAVFQVMLKRVKSTRAARRGGGRFYHNYKALQEVWARDMFMKGRQVL